MLQFVHISDTHLSADPDYHPPWLRTSIRHPSYGAEDLLARVNSLPFDIDFVLHTGDLCADPAEADYHAAREWLLRFEAPVYVLPGNHDSADFMRQIVPEREKLHVLLDDRVRIKDAYLIALDTNDEGESHAPTLAEAKFEALAANLKAAAGAPIIAAMHHPLMESGVPWQDENMRVQNGERAHQLLSRHSSQILGVFYGHIHQPVSTHRDGVSYFSAPSTWSNLMPFPDSDDDQSDPDMPPGFNLALANAGRLFIRHYALPLQRR